MSISPTPHLPSETTVRQLFLSVRYPRLVAFFPQLRCVPQVLQLARGRLPKPSPPPPARRYRSAARSQTATYTRAHACWRTSTAHLAGTAARDSLAQLFDDSFGDS
eukprot:6194739-Pleurochrysis_carterae.AAC.1